ncbi:preprotein translocase subunit SecE [Tengunoibacter tsumagoiensis]|uniref:Protein translocase subunit SecE n=1 Tax=Tengunoibacter tsumagoiensis TaxID=2014871 RepID=A0A401ZVE7_9CHLR|nr:preprotein translocase subunit SecE [Tengunoibacter tsumagoiensis]GCE10885.1 hypothetical protein KTT_07440 [Tengunoibacter tsumagoiensis]
MAKNMTEKKKVTGRSQVTELPSGEAQVMKSVKASAKEDSRVSTNQDKKATVRRDGKKTQSSILAPLRNNKFGRFLIDAYYELRHKVTWPTFLQARNMTVAVVAISVVIGGILALLDLGLFRLFLLITGGK